jgi:ribonuclease HII
LIDKELQEKISWWLPDCNGDTLHIERLLCSQGIITVAGIDEAGRGPLAGPVVAAAVILPQDCSIQGITDSKRIPHIKRTHLALAIKKNAIDIGIGVVEPEEIDRINILQATNKAICIAVDSLSVEADIFLIDGKYLDYPNKRVVTVVKGDLYCRAISAASIIAKVTRDTIMEDLHHEYPMYGFNDNKGYPTVKHKLAIKQYGISPVHRRSFSS